METEIIKKDIKPSFRIDIFDNTANFTEFNSKKSIVKTLKIESLVKAFRDTETTIESPLLPLNTIKYKEHGNSIIVLLYYPETKFTAHYSNEVFENCARPNLIMQFVLNKNDNLYTISKSNCFGVKEKDILINENTKLYGLPFPNIGSGGWICWGSNSMSGSLVSLMGLNVYIDRLFGSPFNTHLFNTVLLKPFGINSPKELFQYLTTVDVFPQAMLENYNNVTIRSLYA